MIDLDEEWIEEAKKALQEVRFAGTRLLFTEEYVEALARAALSAVVAKIEERVREERGRPDFGYVYAEHEGITLSCKAIAPGLTLHDLAVAFEEASSKAAPGDELAGDPSKWPLNRGISAVADAMLTAVYGPAPPPCDPADPFHEYELYNTADWDGYGAEPITPETLEAAKMLYALITKEPWIAPGADGTIGFEWKPDNTDAVFIDVGPGRKWKTYWRTAHNAAAVRGKERSDLVKRGAAATWKDKCECSACQDTFRRAAEFVLREMWAATTLSNNVTDLEGRDFLRAFAASHSLDIKETADE